MRWRKEAALGLAVIGAAVWAGSAFAAAQPGMYSFHDCVGPAGTPTSFTAVKEYPSPSSRNGVSAALSFRLTDGSGVFVVEAFDGVTVAPGIPAGNLTTTCLVDFAAPVGTLPVSGFIAGP
jgi:hypothetical protein